MITGNIIGGKPIQLKESEKKDNSIVGNTIGGNPSSPKTIMLETEDGRRLYGVFVESETIFDAEDTDLREGKVAASDSGVIVGTAKSFDGTLGSVRLS